MLAYPPDAPKNVAVDEVDEDSAVIKWEKPYDGGSKITAYEVEEIDNKVPKQMDDDMDMDAEFLNLQAGTEYNFKVRAQNAVGWGPWAELNGVKTKAKPPGPPINVNYMDVTATGCLITWKPPEDDGGSPVTGYQVEESSGAGVGTRDGITKENASFSTLEKKTEYKFRVRAQNEAGWGEWSQPCQPFTTLADIPEPPINLEVADITARKILLQWDDGETNGAPILGYEVMEVDEKFEDSIAEIEDPRDRNTEWTRKEHKVKPKSIYNFKVRAKNEIGWSKYSEIVEAETPKMKKPEGNPWRPYVADALSWGFKRFTVAHSGANTRLDGTRTNDEDCDVLEDLDFDADIAGTRYEYWKSPWLVTEKDEYDDAVIAKLTSMDSDQLWQLTMMAVKCGERLDEQIMLVGCWDETIKKTNPDTCRKKLDEIADAMSGDPKVRESLGMDQISKL